MKIDNKEWERERGREKQYLDLGFDIVDGVTALNLKSDGLSS